MATDPYREWLVAEIAKTERGGTERIALRDALKRYERSRLDAEPPDRAAVIGYYDLTLEDIDRGVIAWWKDTGLAGRVDEHDRSHMAFAIHAIMAGRKMRPPDRDAEPPGGWRDISTAPCDDTWALVWFDPPGRMEVTDLDHDSDPAWWKERGATHWQPLPAPPPPAAQEPKQ